MRVTSYGGYMDYSTSAYYSDSGEGTLAISSDPTPTLSTYLTQVQYSKVYEPSVKSMQEYLNGTVPERGSNVVELIRKFVF